MRRVELAQLPTPLERADRLRELWGGPELWIKRDDLTGFGLSGNKVRKLEFQLGLAADKEATVLITCGAVQSNHCRATALAAARVGLGCVLLLRSADGAAPQQVVGNHLLQRLAGADVRFITPAQYQDRSTELDAVADELRSRGEVPHIIPEGASDGLGVAAFELALCELADQIEGPVTVWHASSSAGTTAGLALGASKVDGDFQVVGSSVGDTQDYLGGRVAELLAEFDADEARYEIVDDYIGLGYGRTTSEELAVQLEATRATGLIWDPTYTGKALFALRREIERGRFASTDRVVFWHTGGGFAAFAHDFSEVLASGPLSG